MWELFRLGRGKVPRDEYNGLLDRQFHAMWPVLLGVYFANAFVVVMNYQFVNGLLFVLAGMLAAQQRRAKPNSDYKPSLLLRQCAVPHPEPRSF